MAWSSILVKLLSIMSYQQSNPTLWPVLRASHATHWTTTCISSTERNISFNSSKRNVTVLLFGGEHVLSINNTECGLLYYGTFIAVCAHVIQDLEVFEMIGINLAQTTAFYQHKISECQQVTFCKFNNSCLYQENFYCYSISTCQWMCRVKKIFKFELYTWWSSCMLKIYRLVSPLWSFLESSVVKMLIMMLSWLCCRYYNIPILLICWVFMRKLVLVISA